MGDLQGPLELVWVQDIQVRVATMGVVLGIVMRILKFKLHIVHPERLLFYTFIVALFFTILTFFEMGMSFGLAHIKGLLIAAGNITISMLGTGKAIDLGADSMGLNIQKHDANNRETKKWRA